MHPQTRAPRPGGRAKPGRIRIRAWLQPCRSRPRRLQALAPDGKIRIVTSAFLNQLWILRLALNDRLALYRVLLAVTLARNPAFWIALPADLAKSHLLVDNSYYPLLKC